tara:strand:+ start:1617 stop:2441 length:825 start_codon:yes stop_codon:yes gene_type:complete
MVKLCLGSANFGNKYGFNNKKVNKAHLSKIINTAITNDLLNIDTSFEYFNSHQELKRVISKHMIVNTKIFLNNKTSFISIKKKILNFNKNSPSKIYSLLLHEQKDGLNITKVSLLKRLKEEKIVHKIGVSVYDLHILKNILKLWTPDIVQIPLNPFNREFVSKNFLNDLKKKKIIIFARSIFLKGILIGNNYSLNNRFKKDIDDWFNFCKLKSINPIKACLDFCKSLNSLDFLIIGVQNVSELNQIITFFKQPQNKNLKFINQKKYKKIDLRKI